MQLTLAGCRRVGVKRVRDGGPVIDGLHMRDMAARLLRLNRRQQKHGNQQQRNAGGNQNIMALFHSDFFAI